MTPLSLHIYGVDLKNCRHSVAFNIHSVSGRLVRKVAERLPNDAIAGFYTVDARSETSGERLGLDVGKSSSPHIPATSESCWSSTRQASRIQQLLSLCCLRVISVSFSGERAPLCRLRRGCGPKVQYHGAVMPTHLGVPFNEQHHYDNTLIRRSMVFVV